MRTIYLQFKEAAEKHKRRPAVCRKIGGQWRTLSYLELLKRVDRLAAGLKKIGLKEGGRAAIMSENCPEWLMADLALNKLGAVSVPIHTTSNRPFIEHILKDSMSGFLFVSVSCLKKNIEIFRPAAGLKIAVINRAEDHIVGLREEPAGGFLNFDDLSGDPAGIEPVSGRLSSIIYTSGTTGRPKGVMLTNENFLFDANGALEKIKVFSRDVFLSFLPLSHVLERTAGSYAPIFSGASIAYAPDIRQLAACFREVRPTIFVGVPKIFENSYEKIFNGLEKKNRFIRKFFFYSLKSGASARLRKFADRTLYRAIRKNFGGRLRFSISGGASLNESIIRFFRKIGVPVIEGYGLTETSPVIAMNALENPLPGTVGRPLSGVEIKIAADKEILVRGKNIMAGYWNNEAMTKEVFTEDGWFKTGDLGFMDREKYLTIIGRKKEIIVTSNGKNISPEKVESMLNLNPLIAQCLVVGHRRPHLCGLIVPEEKEIARREGGEMAAEALIGAEVERINHRLMSHERIKKFFVIKKPFTVEDGELTPTLKVRRSVIEHKYRREIEKLY